MAPNRDPVTLVDVGRPKMPGCLTVTSVDASGGDVDRMDEFVINIMGALVEQPGFLGTLFASTTNGRHFTVSAWESVEAVEGLRLTDHVDAMRTFFQGALGTRAMTSVWIPHHFNDVWTRPSDKSRPERSAPTAAQWL